MSLRPSRIRVRLTLWYTGAFFAAGAVLIALVHYFLGHALQRQLAVRYDITAHDWGDVLHSMFRISLISLAAVGVCAAGVGWLLAGRVLDPLQQITATARRVAEHDRSLHERIGMQGPHDEIKDLADTFDQMLERLDQAFDSQRRFVANASHELRTPLTLNRTLIEVTLDDPDAHPAVRQLGATLLAINQRHERLIDGLLTLASSEEGLTQPSTVDLADVARHVISDHPGMDMRTELLPAQVLGDAVLLERLTHNLVDNATRYNLPEGGTVAVATDVIDGQAQLTVENTGPTIPAYEVPSLFQPFRRLPDGERLSGQGVGLGLSIVAAIARAHGGQVHAQPREGGGLTVRVKIAARHPSP